LTGQFTGLATTVAAVSVVPSVVLDVAHQLFADDAPHGRSLALVVQHHGEVVFEQYGMQPDTVFGPGGPVGPDTTLISWSMAKSITHAAVGLAVADGLLDVSAPAPVPAWAGTDKAAITLQDLLDMRSGLLFVEDYVDGSISHCLEMLYGAGKDDMATYAASLPLVHEPGTVWNYSSGTTNIIARIVTDALPGNAMETFLRDRLFGPTGMTSAIAKFDPAGTFIGSSYVYATARDFARFGQLYLDDGVCGGQRLLPVGWRDQARTFVASDPDGDFDYGRQWWLWREYPGSLGCHGYEGQYTVVLPDRDLVVVHLGKSPIDDRSSLDSGLRSIFDAFGAG
jgi:CubicO group peptidase (beta-lactamase class C family)